MRPQPVSERAPGRPKYSFYDYPGENIMCVISCSAYAGWNFGDDETTSASEYAFECGYSAADPGFFVGFDGSHPRFLYGFRGRSIPASPIVSLRNI